MSDPRHGLNSRFSLASIKGADPPRGGSVRTRLGVKQLLQFAVPVAPNMAVGANNVEIMGWRKTVGSANGAADIHPIKQEWTLAFPWGKVTEGRRIATLESTG